MRLSALALDDDGTIAQGDAIGASVREAIAAVRDSGISVLLVTGRILSELCRVAGDLHFVDGVVAENGAVIHFPANDYSQVLAPPVAPARADTPQVTVLKSGVVDGMAYSLYSDGSIEAQMPEGMMRFASIDELRAHLDQRP